MPILDLQRRQTEVGRLRIGQKVSTKNGGSRPDKLDRFRFTTASRTLIDQVAAMYGGQVTEWTPPSGAKQWEVITTATSLAVVVPPNSVSQWYETWTGGGCARRCDGQREVISDSPCMCSPEPEARECKPTTRISLMLADIPGIGVWRLETHGFYAATELPAVAELLAAAGGYVKARLELEQRSAKRPKKGGGVETRHWMVPVLHVDAAPARLLALTSDGNGSGAPALTTVDQRPALADRPALPPPARNWLGEIAAAKNAVQLNRLKDDMQTAGVRDPQVVDAWKARGAEILAAAAEQPVDAELEPDVDEVWNRIVSAAPDDWGLAGVQDRIAKFLDGKSADDANGFELSAFLDAMKNGQVAA